MKIYIAKYPGGVHTLELHSGTTVGQAIEIAKREWPNVSFEGSIRINHQPVGLNTELSDGQTIIIADDIKGNQTAVTIRKIPGKDSETSLTFQGTTTVGQILNLANASNVTGGPIGDIEGYTIRLDGVEVTKETPVLDDGQTHRVFMSTKLKGN